MFRRAASIWKKNSPELLGLFSGAFPDFVLASRPAPQVSGVPVFCFHQVEADWFEADLQFLHQNGYTTIDADQMAAFLEKRVTLSPRSVMLTFDDGPLNFYRVAFPLLQQYRQKAVIFVAPALHEEMNDHLDPGLPRPMSWEQLRELHDSALVQVQSHTYESRYIPRWPEPVPLDGCHPLVEAARRGPPLPLEQDLRAARELLESRLPGNRAVHLAFPAYDGSDAALEAARGAGYESCYWGMLRQRPDNTAGLTPYGISRIGGEYLRRLPGAGRVSMAELVRRRVRVIGAGRRRDSGYASATP